MPGSQQEVPGRPPTGREGREAPPLPAPLPAGNAESAVFARAEQYVRGVLLEDSAMQGCCCSAGAAAAVIFLQGSPLKVTPVTVTQYEAFWLQRHFSNFTTDLSCSKRWSNI